MLKLIIALLMDPVLIFMGDAFDPIRSGVLIRMGANYVLSSIINVHQNSAWLINILTKFLS